MSQPLVVHYVDLAVRMKNLLEYAQASLGIDRIFYDDQEMIPAGKTVCVVPGPDRVPTVTPTQMVEKRLVVYVLIYVSKIQDTISNRLEADNLSKAIEKYIHQNLQMRDAQGNNPILIHGYFVENDPGYSIKQRTLFRSVRMTYEGLTKTLLGA